MEATYDPEKGHILPSFALHEAQQIMTRSDFVRALDRLNLFSITSKAQVRASSVPMHHAFRQIVAEPGFRDHLEATIERIAAIESLGRTRELVAKDLVLGGRYEIAMPSGGAPAPVASSSSGSPSFSDLVARTRAGAGGAATENGGNNKVIVTLKEGSQIRQEREEAEAEAEEEMLAAGTAR